ncbi:MAG: 30S ribosomal protein S21 [Bacteriovoracaceae bacterium]|nr:30S ribosomal protein S21 [Bacteriovoracaceae bacterium]
MEKLGAVAVKITESDNVNWALKKFKRLCDKRGITKEYRARKEHKKPSVEMKEKQEAAEKRRLKELRKKRGRRSRKI